MGSNADRKPRGPEVTWAGMRNFFSVHASGLGTIFGRFSINYFSGFIGLRIRVRVWVRVRVRVRVRVWVRVSVGVVVRVSVVIWSG